MAHIALHGCRLREVPRVAGIDAGIVRHVVRSCTVDGNDAVVHGKLTEILAGCEYRAFAHRTKPCILCRRPVAAAGEENAASFLATYPNLAFLASYSVSYLQAIGRINHGIVRQVLNDV